MIKKLDRKRFNAFVGFSRSPAAAYISRELEWYSDDEEKVLGVLLLDTIDEDYVAIILGRDEGGRFRAIDQEVSIGEIEDARDWLQIKLSLYSSRKDGYFPQGDLSKGIDLFAPLVAEEQQHPYFKQLINNSIFLPAKSIIQEMMPHFIDIDGNFVQQFQSTGFDSRLWELYLNSYLAEEKLFVDRTHYAPDFLVSQYGKTVAIEAVIVGRKASNPPHQTNKLKFYDNPAELASEKEDAMPIRFGSPLFSKLQKKYWELPHVKGNPFILAIADFHDDQSMLWSFTSLINYLYGVRHESYHDENGKLVIVPIPIKSHRVGDKVIPSGFFSQPNTEHISAVLSSANGTISKFNRIGKQCGFGDPRVSMIRVGTCQNHDPNAALPHAFQYDVDESCEETWGEGLSMYHNPNAIHPVPEYLFPSIGHHWYSNGQIKSVMPEFYPFSSLTFHFRATKS